MDAGGPQITVRTSITFLLLVLLQTSTQTLLICVIPASVSIDENNEPGALVLRIKVEENVTLWFVPTKDSGSFTLEEGPGEYLLKAKIKLDHEAESIHTLEIMCFQNTTDIEQSNTLHVSVTNLNDNPPVFPPGPCLLEVKELLPVGTLVGSCPATDADMMPLSYTLSPESEGFRLQSSSSANILIQSLLDYDHVQNVRLILHVQDEPPESNSASTTVLVTITDVDNRLPWFQPCTKYNVDGATICQNAGYTGSITLNELEVGPLPLTPGPLHAIDGDAGINEEITYTIVSGDDANVFTIGAASGNISMLRAADNAAPITLTVMAAQKTDKFRSSTTTVSFRVLVKSRHPPQFENPRYEGVVSTVGSMVMDLNNKDRPLQILARDEDYATMGGLNPHVAYRLNDSSSFSLVNGYLFLIRDLPAGTVSMQVEAVDTTNDESATSQVTVDVNPGLSTTTASPSTTDATDTAPSPTGDAATTLATTADTTTNPTTSPEGSTSTVTTAPLLTGGVVDPPGDFGVADMVALGATLGVLLFVCLLVVSLLVCRVRKGNAAWRKVHEANVFRSSLGQSSSARKEGVQFTNEAFQNHDEDVGSSGSGDSKGQKMTGSERAMDDAVPKPAPSQHGVQREDVSEQDAEKTEEEEKVKPILTRERRVEDGYKAVWFKEDIDPNAKEEVVIIPDGGDEEDEEDDEDDASHTKVPKVVFADSDLDSGLGVKMEDRAEDSEDDDILTVNL